MLPGRVAGMNMTPTQDHDLAATLRALSLPAGRADPPRKGRSRWLPWAVLTLVAAGAMGVIATLAGRHSAPAASAPPTEAAALMAPPPPPPMAALAEITGSGHVVAPQTVSLHAHRAGRVLSVAVEPGDRVAAGQELARIAGDEARFDLESLRIARRSARLELEARQIDTMAAEQDRDRLALLAARDAVPVHMLETAGTALRRARNLLEQSRQSLAQAGLALRRAQRDADRLVIRAPFAGTVTALSVHAGDLVADEADSVAAGRGLMAIADTSQLVIDADVSQSSLAALRPGLSGEAVLDGFPAQPFPILLERISPVASLEKGTVTLRFRLSGAPEGIRPNMAARIRLTIPEPTAIQGPHL